MRVDLHEPAQPKCPHVSAGLAHRLGSHLKIAVLHTRVRNDDGSDDATASSVKHPIEITDLFHPSRVFCKFVEHDGPSKLGNDNHSGIPLSPDGNL